MFNSVYRLEIVTVACFILFFVTAFGQTNNDPCYHHEDGRYGYCTLFGDGTVAVIDFKERKVIERIPTGSGPAGIAYVPAQNKMYVANQLSGSVSVIIVPREIGNSTSVTYVIYTDPGSTPVSTTLHGTFMWVTLAEKNIVGPNSVSAPGVIAVFDTVTDKLVKLIPLDEPYGFPVDLQFIDEYAYLPLMFLNNPTLGGDIVEIDSITGVIIRHIPVGTGSQPASISPLSDGRTIYCTGSATTRMVAVDVRTGNLTFIPNPIGALQVVKTRNDEFEWVAASNVTKINTRTKTVVATIPVDGPAIGDTISPDEKFLYSVNVVSSTITVIDTELNVAVATFSIGTPGVSDPIELAIVSSIPVEP